VCPYGASTGNTEPEAGDAESFLPVLDCLAPFRLHTGTTMLADSVVFTPLNKVSHNVEKAAKEPPPAIDVENEAKVVFHSVGDTMGETQRRGIQ